MGEEIRVRGVVQGVGFRPTVARLARAQGLAGFVRNDADGVLIGLVADEARCSRFLEALMDALPPLASVESVERRPAAVVAEGFTIEASEGGEPRTEVRADAASCDACVAEVFDPEERRFRYPFATCTHCGPRYSIVAAIPYDRANTTMAGFPLCDACRAEYEDEEDRRYHAQPLACAACGPTARLERMGGGARDLDAVAELLAAGEVVAVKGLGGYQLCCDATDEAAVQRLRRRKGRPHKALALMVRDLDVAARFVTMSDAERGLLASPEAPIVLCDRRGEVDATWAVAEAVAPDQRRLGVMLPTSPLHHLMLERVDRPVICTSGNVTDEPQQIDDDAALVKLAGIADWRLVHDRPIRNRVDDSVVATIDGAPRVLRRARGYAPAALVLPPGFEEAPAITALGGELKGCFALVSEGRAVLSPHLGDLDHPEAHAAYQDTLALLTELYAHVPAVIAYDAYPGYRIHEMGRALAKAEGVGGVEVLHHQAHVASCLAENGWARDAGPVLGLALDGLGGGVDGALWGGELFFGDYRTMERVGTLEPAALLGGDQAARQPWRNLYAQLRRAFTWEELDARGGEVVAYLRSKPVTLLEQMLGDASLAPEASSAGRLFDAVAAALGLAREGIGYEGQAAMMLEGLVTPEALRDAGRPYAFEIRQGEVLVLSSRGMWTTLLDELTAQVDASLISARFHLGLADGLARMVQLASQRTGCQTVALSGGCFLNRALVESLAAALRGAGLTVLLHEHVPPHDGGLALGQAVIAAARSLAR